VITGVIGELGLGKTATLTYCGYQAFLKGELVFSNYPLYFEHIKLTHPAHLFFIGEILDKVTVGGKVLLDEAWRWISSFLSQQKIQLVLSYIYTKSRKERWDLLYSTQRFKSIQIRLRSISDSLFAPRGVPLGEVTPESFKVTVTDTQGLLKGKPFRFNLKEVIDLYDHEAETYGFEDFQKSLLDQLVGVPIEKFHLGKLDIGEQRLEE